MRRNPGQRTRTPRTAVIICAVLLAAVGTAMAGCRSSHDPSALPHSSCGSAITHFLNGHTQVLSADPGALACFVRAARHCRAGSLRVTQMGVDTGTDYVFAITPGTRPCQVTELSQDYSANFGGSQGAISTVPCHRTAVTSSGVVLRCHGRIVLIPAKAAGRVSAP